MLLCLGGQMGTTLPTSTFLRRFGKHGKHLERSARDVVHFQMPYVWIWRLRIPSHRLPRYKWQQRDGPAPGPPIPGPPIRPLPPTSGRGTGHRGPDTCQNDGAGVLPVDQTTNVGRRGNPPPLSEAYQCSTNARLT